MASDPKALIELYAERYPEAWREICPKRYITPKKLAGQYPSMDTLSCADMTCVLASHPSKVDVSIGKNLIGLLLRAHHGMPTYYLTRELGDALIRTRMPEDDLTTLLQWPFPGLRIVLPKNWIALNGQDIPYFDMYHLPTGGIPEPTPGIARSHIMPSIGPNPKPWVTIAFLQIQTTTNEEDGGMVLGYHLTEEWNDNKLKEIAQKTVDALDFPTEPSSMPLTPQEDIVLSQLFVLGLNILLFMSEEPKEVTSESMVRKGATAHDRHTVWTPRFIGQPIFQSVSNSGPGKANGLKFPGQWRSGHWKRQAYGQGHSLRKLIRIQPYKTGDS